MGTTYGIKLLQISSNHTLGKVTFLGNKTIIPYIYYIIKFNHLPIPPYPYSQMVQEITITNIFTKKENVIQISPGEIDSLLLEGVTYTYEECPMLESVLLISSVPKNSLSDKKGIVKERMILLGTKTKFFSKIDHVEEEINKGNLIFLFYDFINETIINVDFGLYQNKDKIQMGFECQMISMNDFITNYLENKAIRFLTNTISNNKDKTKSISNDPQNKIVSPEYIPRTTDTIGSVLTEEPFGNSNTNNEKAKTDTEIVTTNKADNPIETSLIVNDANNIKWIPREKYKRQLDVYLKIDSNYNFINSNKNELLSQIANKSQTNLTNTNKILIKSIQLPTSLSIEDLYMNAYLIRKPFKNII